jgi:hypothetical protein
MALGGVGATGTVNTVTIGERLVAITGCPAMGQVGDIGLRFWSLIDNSEDANWSKINNAQDAVWTNITTQAA